ncbi:MAG TPA: sugar phosphate nucleotidyltransferase [Myxococcota bacterium]|nr:sugar phosphate nucleotidyltransferase [Myxococcota bacterium]HND30251.1 sugar phosphate nucleotidyltransferase [Myxococcota bacterium]HNH46376.1 sugar phosphate nucleotidyltransferase [Myxococcota bacterium]
MAATAFILAAGLGTRLRPLTLATPKPLLPVRGRPMLDHVLALARRYGHDEVVVNAFWLPEQIQAWAEGKTGVRVVVEAPVVLGTGGGLRNAAPLLAERFVVLNGDILCDVDLGALMAMPTPAAMALRAQAQARHTGIAWDPQTQRVTGIAGVVGTGDPAWHFTGVHVLNRELLESIPSGEQCIIRTVYKALVPQGRVGAQLHTGAWADIGTPEEYAAAQG